MKKEYVVNAHKCVAAVLTAAISVSMLVGCGTKGASEAEEPDEIITISENEDIPEEEVNIGNPWVIADNLTVLDETGIYIEAPESATNIEYSYLKDSNLAQAVYSYNDCDWTFRIQKTDTLTDISGMYYEWGYVGEGKVAGLDAIYYGYSEDSDSGMLDGLMGVQLVNWYDEDTGLTYSLSAEGVEIGGMDIQVFAEELFNAL